MLITKTLYAIRKLSIHVIKIITIKKFLDTSYVKFIFICVMALNTMIGPNKLYWADAIMIMLPM